MNVMVCLLAGLLHCQAVDYSHWRSLAKAGSEATLCDTGSDHVDCWNITEASAQAMIREHKCVEAHHSVDQAKNDLDTARREATSASANVWNARRNIEEARKYRVKPTVGLDYAEKMASATANIVGSAENYLKRAYELEKEKCSPVIPEMCRNGSPFLKASQKRPAQDPLRVYEFVHRKFGGMWYRISGQDLGINPSFQLLQLRLARLYCFEII